MRLFLFDDAVAREWTPFAVTRPISELLFGTLTLRQRSSRALGLEVAGTLDTGGLLGFEEEGAAPVVGLAAVPADTPRIYLSSRAVLPLPAERGAEHRTRDRSERQSGAHVLAGPFDSAVGARLTVGGEPVGWVLAPGAAPPDLEALRAPAAASDGGREPIELGGTVLPDLWTLMAENAERVARDLRLAFDEGHWDRVEGGERLEVLGTHPVTVEADVRFDPWVVLDARDGPIHFAAGVHVHSFTKLHGPAWVGRGSTLLGGAFSGISCGPVTKLRGEVEASVILGYSNKAHDGYLGHAVMGRWVNLGAFTTNSDLKNNYGPVRVPTRQGERDSGLMKVGAFVGDHVKTGIGTLLNTGTVVGAGSNLFGGAMPPRWVPPFSWGAGEELSVFREDEFLEGAQRAMARRKVELSTDMRAFLRAAWRRAAQERTGSSRT